MPVCQKIEKTHVEDDDVETPILNPYSVVQYELAYFFSGLMIIYLSKRIEFFLFFEFISRAKWLTYQLFGKVIDNWVDNRIKAAKIKSHLFNLIHFSCSFVFLLNIVLREEWFYLKDFYNRNQPMSYIIVVQYAYSVSYYAVELIDLLFSCGKLEKYEMIIHHNLTLVLLISSYTVNQYRYSLVVQLLHDLSDPLIETTKIFFLAGVELPSRIIFAIWAIVFIGSRVFVYPWAILITVGEDYTKIVSMERVVIRSIYATLTILWFVHIYWSSKIILVLKKVVDELL